MFFKNNLNILVSMILSSLVFIFLYSNEYILSAYIFSPLAFATYLIFTTKKAYPLRFMYPGLLTFIFFMVIPISFTIYIAFTNLGTGHLLTKDALIDSLVKEKFINPTDEPYEFEVFRQVETEDKNTEKKQIVIRINGSYTALIKAFEKKVITTKTQKKDTINNQLKKLNLSEVFAIKELLINKEYYLPGEKVPLNFYRLDKLIKLKNKYTKKSSSIIHDNQFNIDYQSNEEKGYFQSHKHILAPGYFTNIGLTNFKKLFLTSEYRKPFLKLFSWTFTWAFFSVATTFVLGLFFALLLNDKKLSLRPIYRIFIIIPYSIPFFISVLIFKGMLNQDFGIINQIISPDGAFKLPWLSDPFLAKISCLMVNLWLGFPYMFLIITGVLQSIPASIYEAAALDGAGKWTQLKKLTLPLIMSSIGPLLVGSFAFNMNNFVGIYLLTGGGPALPDTSTPLGETDILISYTYRLAFEGGQGQDFALASSISIIIFFIVATLTIINFKVTGMVKDEQA